MIKLDLEDTFPDEETKTQARLFFLDFLQRWRMRSLPKDQKKAVDSALLKYLATNDKDGMQLADLVMDCDTDQEETCALLKANNKFHCLAVFHASRNDWENAFVMWDRLVKKELTDEHFPGPSYVADQLTKYDKVCP